MNRREIRVLVEARDSGQGADEVARVASELSMGVAHLDVLTVAPLFPGSNDIALRNIYLIRGELDGTYDDPAVASRTFDLVHMFQGSDAFASAEADLPTDAFEPPDAVPAFGEVSCDDVAGTDDKRWAQANIRCREAWALPLPPGGAARGKGIRIGHPDTGYSHHPRLGLEAFDLATDRDFVDDDLDARDPLQRSDNLWDRSLSPGHGTSTGSVIAGRGDDQLGIVGVAPEATLVPIRAIRSVIQFFDSDVARAVNHAVDQGCHVISMSLGGMGFFGLKRAIRRAVSKGLIVIAAAGNNVRIVVAPACYNVCLAVSATGINHEPWQGSSRGSAVDIAAPGECVWVANFDWKERDQDGNPGPRVGRSHGTSYGVAHVAGVAALWLAYHGRDHLIALYGQERLQSVFLHLACKTAHVPFGWDKQFGCGIINAEALLAHALPDLDDVSELVGAFAADSRPEERIAAFLTDVDAETVRERLGLMLGAQAVELDEKLIRYESEITYLLLQDAAFLQSFVHPAPGAFAPEPPAAASGELKREFARI